jgi:hypothetical protein
MSSSSSWPVDPQTSYCPLCLTASLTSASALPSPPLLGSTTLLNGPFLGRFPIRSNLSFSSCDNVCLRFVDAEGREKTAGTADRWERILVDVSEAADNFAALRAEII